MCGATATDQLVKPNLAIAFEGCPADGTCMEPYMGAGTLCWVYAASKRDCRVCLLRERCLSESVQRGARRLVHSAFAEQKTDLVRGYLCYSEMGA